MGDVVSDPIRVSDVPSFRARFELDVPVVTVQSEGARVELHVLLEDAGKLHADAVLGRAVVPLAFHGVGGGLARGLRAVVRSVPPLGVGTKAYVACPIEQLADVPSHAEQ